VNDNPEITSLTALSFKKIKNIMNNENQNTLKSWATGKLAMFALGLGVAYFLYKSSLIQKLTSKIFAKKEAE